MPASRHLQPTNRSPLSRRVALALALLAAACGGDSPTQPVNPQPVVPVATVTVTPIAGPFERGTTQQFVAVTRDAAGTILTGRTITWSSSVPAAISIDANTGLATVLDRGRGTVTATSEGRSGSAAVEGVIYYRSITAGDGFSCDLGSIGVASCWGSNGGQDGRLGNGALDNSALTDSPVPVNVLGGLRFTTIVSGQRHSCGLTSAGAAYCWGSNGNGALGAPSVPSWAHQPVLVSGGLTFTSLTAGMTHTCGITTTGAAYCWGANGEGQLGNGTQARGDVPVAVSGGIAFAQISAGLSTGNNNVTCGVATDGRGYCWGSDAYGQIGDGGALTSQVTDVRLTPTLVTGGYTWKSIAVGVEHVCGVRTNGAAMCWGDGASGKLGTGADTPGETAPSLVAGGLAFGQVEVGYANSCGITQGTFQLYCWGANVSGESGSALPLGDTGRSPALAATGEWADVNLGGTSAHTCMISRDRLSVRCMGEDNYGQLGNGVTTPVGTPNTTPVLVQGQQPLP